MRFSALTLAGIFTCATALAATDPFVGTWIYKAQKSPKPTIQYTIKDLGGSRYALTGSTGVMVEIKADGNSGKTPTGATASFKKLNDHQWKMIRDDGEKMVRTCTISPDDKQLTLVDLFTGNPRAMGASGHTAARYVSCTGSDHRRDSAHPRQLPSTRSTSDPDAARSDHQWT